MSRAGDDGQGVEPERAMQVVEEWLSRTATLRRLHDPSGGLDDRVEKCCPTWSAEHVRDSVANAAAFALVHCSGAAAIEVLAHGFDPPSLTVAYVDGNDLDDLLRGGEEPGEAQRIMRAIGGLLAGWHSLTASSGGATKRLGREVQSAGDFGVYNFRLRADGEVVYIEPPAWVRRVSAHRDVAWFLDSLTGVGLGRTASRSLRLAFVEGYLAASGTTRLRASDKALLGLHLARRWRGRRRSKR